VIGVSLVIRKGASYDFAPMKRRIQFALALLFGVGHLCCGTLHGQGTRPAAQNPSSQNPAPQNSPVQNPTAPLGPVPISEEPHHRLVLQNDFVHVYNVMVPPLDATLLHQHDLPYIYLTLGATELVNAIQGQPEARLTLQDGDTHYTPGKFAHLVRTDSGMAFHNITIELVHPQGAARNLCKEVLPGHPTQCPQPTEVASTKTSAKTGTMTSTRKEITATADDEVPYFETDELRVDLRKVAEGRDYVEASPKMNALLVALTDANLDANLGGEHVDFLHGGEVLWLPAGVHRRIVDFLGTHSSFLLISFKDSPPRSAP
jgi:hypothetical protein